MQLSELELASEFSSVETFVEALIIRALLLAFMNEDEEAHGMYMSQIENLASSSNQLEGLQKISSKRMLFSESQPRKHFAVDISVAVLKKQKGNCPDLPIFAHMLCEMLDHPHASGLLDDIGDEGYAKIAEYRALKSVDTVNLIDAMDEILIPD